MKTDILFAILALLIVKGQTTKPPDDLQCYKKTTKDDEDFTCTWSPVVPAQNATYTLFFHADGRGTRALCTENILTCTVVREVIITQRNISMWLEAVTHNHTYKSPNLTVILDSQVKYDAPEITMMSRSSGNLTLQWERQKDEDKDIVYEMALRQNGHEQWHNTTFEISHSNTQERTQHLQEDKAYEVLIRRRPNKIKIWSDWSHTKDIPIEIKSKPEVKWKLERLKDGVRRLQLFWEKPPSLACLGDLWYNLSYLLPCRKQPIIVKTAATNCIINVTASVINVSITAINNVGKSPSAQITIPAHQLDTCEKSQDRHSAHFLDVYKKNKKYCVEWYKLVDGRIRPDSLKRALTNGSQALETIKKEMEDYVRYHYFIHTTGKHVVRHTIAMCPIYKQEGAPRSAPDNITVLSLNHTSALLRWNPLPVSEQRGFLTNYIVYIKHEHKTEVVNVSWFQTNHTIHSLKPGSTYTVHVAGKTAAGLGPNNTKTFQHEIELYPVLSSLHKAIVAGSVILVCTMLLLFIIERIKSKLVPDIPRPVIPEMPAPSHSHLETDPAGENVDLFVLLPHVEGGNERPVLQEERTLVEVYKMHNEDDDEEEQDDCGQMDSDAAEESSFALSPDYKRQTLGCSTTLEQKELSQIKGNGDIMSPTYKNGLVLEIKVENPSEEGTEL